MIIVALSIWLLQRSWQHHRKYIRDWFQYQKDRLPRKWRPKSPEDCPHCQQAVSFSHPHINWDVQPYCHFKSTRGRMVSQIQHAARAEGYDVLIFTRRDSAEVNVSEEVSYFERWQVDGVLNIAPMPEKRYDDISHIYHVPVVQIDLELGDNSPSVVIDQQYGTKW